MAAVSVPRLGVALITMGNRPAEVDALLASVAKRDVPPQRIVVVGNGSPPWPARSPDLGGGLRAWFGGFVEGVREPCGERRPMRWRTVGRMTRRGRPTVI